MKKNTAGVLVICALSLALAGCAQSPAKCSDEKTLAELTGQITGQLDISQLDQIPITSLKVIDTRATAFDENIKKLSCEGTLTMSNQLKLPIRYESQLDDNNKQIVILKDFDVQSLFGSTSSTSTATSPVIAANSITGEWTGQLAGDGSMTVTQSGAGYQVELGVNTSSGCGGAFTGQGQLNGNTLKLVDPVEQDSCVVTVKFAADTAQVSESGCMDYHGAACGFDGTLTKVSGVVADDVTTASADEQSNDQSAQAGIIDKLYADFPAESTDSVQSLAVPKLSKIFTPSLVSLINRDNRCVEESGGICNLDFSLQWDSQDPSDAKETISQGSSPEQIRVTIDGDGDQRELLYVMQQTPNGWRIADIQYRHGSLVEILKR